MSDETAMFDALMRADPPTNAAIESVLADAAEVCVIEADPWGLEAADGAARLTLRGARIAELARMLAIVDGGTGDVCLCPGWPTIIVSGADGAELARWSLHHQQWLRGPGSCDAELRDGEALTDWLADHGLTGSREAQEAVARDRIRWAERRAAWVRAAPAPLATVAEAVSQREDGAEERMAALAVEVFPVARTRIRTLVAWAGFSVRRPAEDGDGTPWHELAPQRMLLAEERDELIAALLSEPLTAAQLDGTAELVTSLKWQRAPMPEPLRGALIAHVSSTGTEPMKFRMRHGYGAGRTD
ncbi:hypothetical protein JCM9533A_07160 [Catenuloplanes niger JCM 9533]